MTETDFPFWAAFQWLDSRLVLAEALAFPEISRLDATQTRLGGLLGCNVRHLLERESFSTLYRRHLGSEPTVGEVAVPLDPIGRGASWRGPLPLSFPVLTWNHGGAAVAFVPALGIEVTADSPETLTERLPTEIRAALARGPAVTLAHLVALQRVKRTRVERLHVNVSLRSPKGRALAALREHEKSPSVLATVADKLTHGAHRPTVGLEPVVAQLAELLGGRLPRSVLLVGPSGVGKTAAVRELAHRRGEHHLGATPFWTTSGARLVAGMCGYGMWQERCRKLIQEAARKKAIVHLGNLMELMQVGKSEHNALGIAAFLRPSLARGDLLAVAECTPEQFPLIEREDPHLLAAFSPLTVAEPDQAQGRAILRQAAGRPLSHDTLDTLDRLHRRYATYSAYPGRPLRFLQGLLRDCSAEAAIRPAHVLAAFARETGLPRVLLDPAERLDLARIAWLAERVIGQAEAVDLVADLIATTKAALSRPRRPIASLLFIGPTGVGKTEMAKALAEFLFGSRERLTRFDMSEFGDPLAVQRLVGGVFGSEGLLTAKVREQPFGVLLLDEFEKAHPLFFDLLLQVLGEGRLTDGAGRLADFTNTVIILTSNLGAESFQQGAFGFADSGGTDEGRRSEAARDHFVRAVQAFLRPELFNRIDRLVPFLPLSASVIRRLADRHLERLALRDGIRHRGVVMQVGADVADHVARTGFDVRYGARPLLRAVERELLAPLAHGLNRFGADTALVADISLEGTEVRCTVKPRLDAGGRPLPINTGSTALAGAAEEITALRRSVQALERCRALREFHNELFQLQAAQDRFEKLQRGHATWMARLAGAPEEVRRRALDREPRVRPADHQRMARLARLRETAEAFHSFTAGAAALEDRALLALYVGGEAASARDLTAAATSLQRRMDELLLTLFCRDFAQANRATLALFAEDPAWLIELAAGYLGAARQSGLSVEMVAYLLPANDTRARDKEGAADAGPAAGGEGGPPEQYWREDTLVRAPAGREPERELLVRKRIKDPNALLAAPPPRLPGLALAFHGVGAGPRFMPEAGLHRLRGTRQSQTVPCLVETTEAGLAAYLPPPGITRQGAIGTQPLRRSYDRGLGFLDDARLDEKTPWKNGPLGPALAETIDRCLRRGMLALLKE